MLKWILRFFYIMIISVATLYVYGSANYGRLEAYYAKYMADELDNDQEYLKGINTLMNLAYYQESPVYQFVSISDTHHLKVSVHAIGITDNNVHYDGLMIFVNELELYDVENNLIEKPIIKITAHLSEKTYKSGDELTDTPTVVFDSTKEFPYSYAPTLFLVYAENYLLIPDTETYATLDRISISYSTGERDTDGQYKYDTTLLYVAAGEDISEAAHNKDNTLSLNEASFRLSTVYGEELSADEIETLGLITDRGSLKEFNGVIVRTMIIYSLIVIALTYVLFFHKLVMDKVKEKRFDKEQPKKDPDKIQDAIFQDIDYPKENKK
jgi:hypothetical protein